MLSIHHLTKYVGASCAVHGVSFHVAETEIAALLGPAGSGKSMVLRLVAGLETPSNGHIAIAGEGVGGIPARRRGVALAGDRVLFDHLTVAENIAFELKAVRTGADRVNGRIMELLDLTGTTGRERYLVVDLSPALRMRVAVARAVASGSRILGLDEPFAALDDGERRSLASLLGHIRSRLGLTILLATQCQEAAMAIADRVVLLNRGRVEQEGAPRELYHAPANRFVASFFGRVNVIEAYVREGIMFLDGRPLAITDPDLAAYTEGDAVLLVRPEDVELTRGERPDGLALKVREVRRLWDRLEVVLVSGDLELRCDVSGGRMEDERWAAGERAWARLMKYRWYPAHEGLAPVRRRLRSLGYIE